uniref:ATP synthase subunit a n=1 Tax=Echyridella menziesii TaxID=981778 RepID=A0A1Y9T626_9BIVA|nr:ATP synthase F0 subunit 6 [Echyridella menziesii]AQT38537.1 ATP synthase F0 subunit 6 [Echyridella menziesii]
MLMDIFSSLDAGTSLGFSLSVVIWLSGFVGALVLVNSFWVDYSAGNLFVYAIFSVVADLVKACSGKFFGGFVVGQVCLFCSILFLNLAGMVPSVFGVTGHLSLTFVLAGVVWFSLIFSGWTYNWTRSVGQLVPTGSPVLLIPLLVLIESVSVLIRPLTLGVRLAANITMGHLMLHVIGGYLAEFVSGSFMMSSLFGSVVMGGYVIFEFAVSFLQAYVFVLLVSLYSSDHYVGH